MAVGGEVAIELVLEEVVQLGNVVPLVAGPLEQQQQMRPGLPAAARGEGGLESVEGSEEFVLPSQVEGEGV